MERREYGEASQSEFTVVKVDAYNGINSYLSELAETHVKTIEDVIEYNDTNSGAEGAQPYAHPAFPSGQVSDICSISIPTKKTRITFTRLLKPKELKARHMIKPSTTFKPSLVEKELTLRLDALMTKVRSLFSMRCSYVIVKGLVSRLLLKQVCLSNRNSR